MHVPRFPLYFLLCYCILLTHTIFNIQFSLYIGVLFRCSLSCGWLVSYFLFDYFFQAYNIMPADQTEEMRIFYCMNNTFVVRRDTSLIGWIDWITNQMQKAELRQSWNNFQLVRVSSRRAIIINSRYFHHQQNNWRRRHVNSSWLRTDLRHFSRIHTYQMVWTRRVKFIAFY